MVVLFAIYAVADAVSVATRAIKGHMSTGDRVLLGLRSLIEVIAAGVALVVWPGIGAVTLALVFGAYLTVAGAVLLVSAAVAPRHRPVPSAA